ncbi:flavo protein [Calocera cornea HHB12733]|uniref:Flavo protein n=1 Tax=Calocera cornea HHB12733 TaxID=1353952 RepID=A0A165FFR4_9BASI|nr:flavo protein [Calocera cornea HHB12733]
MRFPVHTLFRTSARFSLRSRLPALPPSIPPPSSRLPFPSAARPNSTMATHTVELPASDVKDGQMKEVDFGAEDQKVLVSRIGDKVYATSAFCTHYGAPLVKGVLASNGRVTCPWHSACFDVKTGDIEDGPGRDAIHCFRAVLSDDKSKITVTAPIEKTKKANKERLPFLRSKYAPTAPAEADGKGVVIVGGGAGGLSVAEALREYGYAGPVTMFSKETNAPIDRTKLSKSLLDDPSKLEWRPASVLKDTFGVNLRLGTAITAVDTASKTVTVEGGETVGYEKLVLAPGSWPSRLPIPGADLENVFTLRNTDDTKKMQGLKSKGQNIVVIGSSFISMELVAVVMKNEPASLHVIGMETVPFERVLGKEIGAALLKFFEKNGVTFHMGEKTTKINGTATLTGVITGAQKAESVELGNGTVLKADYVVMGVGVRPATQFLQGNAAFSLERDGGLVVDKDLRVKGHTDVFAIGDIAHYPQSPDDSLRRIEHWNVATDHGRAVGAIIAGTEKPYGRVPIFWSALGQQLRYCGIGTSFDEVIIQGNPEELKFLAYYVAGGKVMAVASMQNDPVVMQCSELIRHDIMPTPAELKEGKDPMSIDISSSHAPIKV